VGFGPFCPRYQAAFRVYHPRGGEKVIVTVASWFALGRCATSLDLREVFYREKGFDRASFQFTLDEFGNRQVEG
jgi:hypothetical protein